MDDLIASMQDVQDAQVAAVMDADNDEAYNLSRGPVEATEDPATGLAPADPRVLSSSEPESQTLSQTQSQTQSQPQSQPENTEATREPQDATPAPAEPMAASTETAEPAEAPAADPPAAPAPGPRDLERMIFGGDSGSEIDSDLEDGYLREIGEDTDDDEVAGQAPAAPAPDSGDESLESDGEDEPAQENVKKARKKKAASPDFDGTDASLPKFKKLPGAKPRKRVKKRRPAQEEELENEPVRELSELEKKKLQANRMVDAALEALKPRRRRKGEVDLEEDVDDRLELILSQMRHAAEDDRESVHKKEPATAKLMYLDTAMESLARPAWSEYVLENGGLDVIRLWLEPLENKALPLIDIQRAMFALLDRLPIRTTHLRSSKVGRVVLFYQKCDRVIPDIKSLANALVNRWMRPIIGSSDNYRHKGPSAANVRKPMRPAPVEVKDEAEDLRNRASVPRPSLVAYEYMPVSAALGPSRRKEVSESQRRIRSTMSKIKMKK